MEYADAPDLFAVTLSGTHTAFVPRDLRRRMSGRWRVVEEQQPNEAPARCSDSQARMDPRDTALLERMIRGDAGALEEAYRRHADTVFAYIRSLTGRSDHDEEILQDTFLALWRGASGIEGRSSLLTWLIGVARRQALARMRRAHGRAQRVTIGLDDVCDMPADGPSLEERVLGSAAVAEVSRLVGQLPPLQREVLALAFVHELSYEEMAGVLEVPLGTVKSRLWAARTSLARLVRESGVAVQPRLRDATERPVREKGGGSV